MFIRLQKYSKRIHSLFLFLVVLASGLTGFGMRSNHKNTSLIKDITQAKTAYAEVVGGGTSACTGGGSTSMTGGSGGGCE
jgi:hypothetical protein